MEKESTGNMMALIDDINEQDIELEDIDLERVDKEIEDQEKAADEKSNNFEAEQLRLGGSDLYEGWKLELIFLKDGKLELIFLKNGNLVKGWGKQWPCMIGQMTVRTIPRRLGNKITFCYQMKDKAIPRVWKVRWIS